MITNRLIISVIILTIGTSGGIVDATKQLDFDMMDAGTIATNICQFQNQPRSQQDWLQLFGAAHYETYQDGSLEFSVASKKVKQVRIIPFSEKASKETVSISFTGGSGPHLTELTKFFGKYSQSLPEREPLWITLKFLPNAPTACKISAYVPFTAGKLDPKARLIQLIIDPNK